MHNTPAPRIATHSTVDGISHLEARRWTTFLSGIKGRLPVGELLVDFVELGAIAIVEGRQYAQLQTLDGRKGLSHGDVGQGAGLVDDAPVPIAHPEGFPLAVANIYVDLAARIAGQGVGNLPTAEDGLRSMASVYAAVESAGKGSAWVDARPPMFR